MTGIQALEQKTLLYDSEKPTRNQGKTCAISKRVLGEF